MDRIRSEPRFDFLSIMNDFSEDDAVPDSFFINEQCSPYSNVNLSCNFLETDELVNLEADKFTVMSINIQSLPAKFSDFTETVNEFTIGPDIICLQETWQVPDNSFFPLQNYHTLVTNLRNNARGGGVGIYVKSNLSFNVLNQYSLFSERIFESLFVEISLPSCKKIVVGSIYRPGKSPGLTFTQQFTQFSEILSNLLADLGDKYEHVFLYGDFNLNVLEVSNNKFITEYIENIFSHGFLQLITRPTRVSENTATILDHILTNSTSLDHNTYILCSRLSDHFPIIHQFNVCKTKSPKGSYVSRNFSPENIERFTTALNNYGWNHVTNSTCTQEATNNFLATFDALYLSFFPLVTKKFNKSINPIEPWMSSGILTSRKQKNLLSKNSLKNPSHATISCFKTYRNLYNQVIKTAKKLYYEKQLTINQKNLRKTWQILFSSIHKEKKNKDDLSHLTINGLHISDPRLMATHFNAFFTSIASKTVQDINPSNISPTELIVQNPNLFSLSNNILTKKEILEATKLLKDKKTPDHTGISTNFIKQTVSAYIDPLFHIFNLSFSTGVVPMQFKIAKVIPIFKSGDKAQMDNYRPISLLSSFSKIMEKIIAMRLIEFLDNNNILSKWQFGFRSAHSTTHPMVHFLNKISDSLNKKKHTISIFCYLKKAFDTCNHSILFSKLEKYGVKNTELNWFKSYLSARKQFVSIKEKSSPLLDISLGVPQGSILGPLLFLIYINDLPLASEFLTLLFADDTTLLFSHDNIDILTATANREFQKVCEFFRANKLVLHPDKTKFIIFSRSNINQDINVVCNNNNIDQNLPANIYPISRVQSNDNSPAVKFLGVYFDPDLNFKFHISFLRKKLSKALYALRTVKNTLNQRSLLLLYNSVFHCHILYAIHIWSCTNSSFVNDLFKLQKSAIRIISGAKYNAHTEPLFKKFEILPLPDLITFSKIQFMQRFTQNLLPCSFNDTWVKNAIRNIGENEIQLRNRFQLQNFYSNLARLDSFPLYSFPKIWESFPSEQIKIIRKISDFDAKLKTFFINDLSSVAVCNRLLCPACMAVQGL